jgi:hypothetical protein
MEGYPLTLTVAAVQKIMGVSRATAYEIVKQEGFPSIRIGAKGGKYVIPTDLFFQWVRAKATHDKRAI